MMAMISSFLDIMREGSPFGYFKRQCRSSYFHNTTFFFFWDFRYTRWFSHNDASIAFSGQK